MSKRVPSRGGAREFQSHAASVGDLKMLRCESTSAVEAVVEVLVGLQEGWGV